jgi:hypothetical protein
MPSALHAHIRESTHNSISIIRRRIWDASFALKTRLSKLTLKVWLGRVGQGLAGMRP